MQGSFKREIDSLAGIFALIEEFFARENIDLQHLYSVTLAADELFTNMLKHGQGNLNEVLVSISRVGDQLQLTLTDYDVDEFDVTKAAVDPLPEALSGLKAGGMGLLLVRRMMDGIHYDYRDRQSKVTVIKKLR